jgi:hypothetical protein
LIRIEKAMILLMFLPRAKPYLSSLENIITTINSPL